MALHVIVGAGPVAVETARLLASDEHTVRLVHHATSASTPPSTLPPGVEAVTGNPADVATMTSLATCAAAIVVCGGTGSRRPREAAAAVTSLLTAAERSGAALTLVRGADGTDGARGVREETDRPRPGRPGTPADMWAKVLAAHRAGRVRATELRAVNVFGPGAADSLLGERTVSRLLAGRPIRTTIDPDRLRPWTYAPDVARAAARACCDERAWGRGWQAPTSPPTTLAQMLAEIAGAAGARAAVVRIGRGWRHIATRPYPPALVDLSAFGATFGVEATPLDEAIRITARWYVDRARCRS